MDLRHLDDLSRDDLQLWLREALRDHRALPKLTHDEPPDVAILRAEPTLDRITRRDLADACVNLIRVFVASPEDDEHYLRALLGLAVGLDLTDRVAPLICAAEFDGLPAVIQRGLLEGLINLRSLQKPEFWYRHLDRSPTELSLTALAGLLATTWIAGIELLPRLEGDEALAFAAAVLVEQALEDLAPAERDRCARALADVLPSCNPAIRDAIRVVVGPYEGSIVARKAASHSAPSRRHPGLPTALSRFPGTSKSIPARLAAA
jgi:hypothetical protein